MHIKMISIFSSTTTKSFEEVKFLVTFEQLTSRNQKMQSDKISVL